MTRLTALFLMCTIFILAGHANAAAWKCPPTPQDEIGPFYRPEIREVSLVF